MVFVCFLGIRKKRFRIGRTVLPKYFLENIGFEGLEVIMRSGMKVAVTSLPKVMVEDFLSDYLGIEIIVGREVKVFCGYYLGLMDVKKEEITNDNDNLKGIFSKEGIKSHVVGIRGSHKPSNELLFTHCSDMYMVREDDKKKWQHLPKAKYPKPLIFHDGRLAFDPTPEATLAMFLWLPFGIFLCIIRLVIALLLPYSLSLPLLSFTGIKTTISTPNSPNCARKKTNSNGIVYVCNHRTLLDPDFISLACGHHLTALTYSISKISEILSPIKTVSLTRDKEKDAKIMQKVLSKGSMVVCPEGTTCREPYLLRFSPLFAEICDEIVPVAIDVKVSMFYGTTASGIKALDPFFFLLNPSATYYVKFLEQLSEKYMCRVNGMSKYDVANHVQAQIGAALGFQCTNLTRKDKYMILAGNAGI